jgi:hypothetical protein
MIRTHKTLFLYLILLPAVLFISGCESLKSIDQQIGRFINGEILGEKISDEIDVISVEASSSPSILSKEQKEKIDKWLELNGFNRYGDLLNTFYSSGTPLFDAASGLTKERYEYILEKHPDVLSKI